MINTIINGDCLEVMKSIPDKSIDMILCDLPYGTTACKWDVVIPFEQLWEQYKRIIKDNGAIVLTGSQPFTTDLINSNRKWFKYELIWDKKRSNQFMLSKIKPLQSHENILVFCNGKTIYNPIKKDKKKDSTIARDKRTNGGVFSQSEHIQINYASRNSKEIYKFPLSVIDVLREIGSNQFKSLNMHPTQKPVALFEYLIRTYTNENETVLDNCSGSGTTAVACINTNRNYICIEKDKTYFDKSVERVAKENIKLKLAI